VLMPSIPSGLALQVQTRMLGRTRQRTGTKQQVTVPVGMTRKTPGRTQNPWVGGSSPARPTIIAARQQPFGRTSTTSPKSWAAEGDDVALV
jgi:hypothetical protein